MFEDRARVTRTAATAAGGYLLLATPVIAWTSDGRSHATVWPADALILALLLNSPRRLWSVILVAGWLGNLAANGITRGWIVGIVLYGAINMAQTLLAGALLDRTLRGRNLLEDTGTSTRFLLVAGYLAPALGATLGSAVSLVNYGQPFAGSFLLWFSSNALGLLIGTPLLQAVLDGSYVRWFHAKPRSDRWEAVLLLLAHTAVVGLVFRQSLLPLEFLPLASLLLLAFRLGRLGTMAGICIIAVVGAAAGYLQLGPLMLMRHGPVVDAFYFQLYLGVILCVTLPVAATVASRAEALAQLAEHRKALQQILKHSPDGILSFDASGLCKWADGRLMDCTGIGPREFVGLTVEQVAEHTSPELQYIIENAAKQSNVPHRVEFRAVHAPERTIEALCNIVPNDDHRSGVVVTLRDISAHKTREDTIARAAEIDDLTGLLNRRGLRNYTSGAFSDPSRHLTLALIDVDRFKSINDTFGHSVGDRVLAGIATRLNENVRSSDAVGRLGGDEFAVFFNCDIVAARIICERMMASLKRSPVFNEDGIRIFASLSCGIAERKPGMTREELYDAADTALYEVKRQGRDGILSAA